ncbi:MAG TPA: hypothetical protein VFS28_04055 [Gemmatimonadales bacterium]|nr:hypothetical protein [Gemmatimonadales bacterium]
MTSPAVTRPPQRRPLTLQAEPASPPPFALPAGHFAAAITWLTLASIGLVAIAPGLARGDFLNPHVFAVVHAVTLGVITTAIFGALYQFFPMALGVNARSVRAGFWGGALLTGGTATIVAGFWWWIPALQGIGWLAIFAAVGVQAWNLLPQRRRATQGKVIGRYVSAGHIALGLAMFLAAARIGVSLGWWSVDRLGMIAAHFHLAALGFATLTAVGVGSRMVPMFLVSHGTPDWPLRWIGPVALAGLVVFSAGEVAHVGTLSTLGGLALVAAALLYLRLAYGYFRRRLRRRLDPGLAHVAAAFGWLALTTGLGLLLLAAPGVEPRWWAAYAVAALLGWLGLLILGILYKILPFLMWMNIHGRRPNPPASVGELLSPPWTWASLTALVAGLLVTVPAIAVGLPTLAQVGAAIWLAGAFLVPSQYVRMLLR